MTFAFIQPLFVYILSHNINKVYLIEVEFWGFTILLSVCALKVEYSVRIVSKTISKEKQLIRQMERLGVKIRRGIVYIVKDRCKGCGACIEFCPMKVLKHSDDFNKQGYHYPVLVEDPPLKVCIACGFCTLICPEFAIYSKPMEESEEESE